MVMPRGTPFVKVQQTRDFGATVVIEDAALWAGVLESSEEGVVEAGGSIAELDQAHAGPGGG